MKFPNKLQQYIENKSYICDQIGMSGAGVYIFEDMVLKVQKIDTESENEVKMLMWLNGKMTVPNIIEHIRENGYSYLLMNKCTGKMACDPEYMKQPKRQVELLAETMHHLWSIPINDCPCQFFLDKRLEMAKDNIINNRVDINDTEPNTFGPNGFRDPDALLYWLQENKPDEEPAICHGDFCLPNIFLSESGLTGMIDLGRAGAADPWLDIALCCRSLEHNYNGVYDGNRYEGYHRQMLFDALGIQPDLERIRYYILLDELF